MAEEIGVAKAELWLRSEALSTLFSSANLLGLAVLAAAVVVALTVHAVVCRVLTRMAAQTEAEKWQKVLQKSRSVGRWLMVLFAVAMAIPLQEMPPRLAAFAAQAVKLSFIAFLGWLALMVVNDLVKYSLSRHRMDAEDNLEARKMRTPLRLLRQALALLIVVIPIATVLMTFPGARSLGVSLFASAGVAGIAVGFAVRSVLSNLLAGLQIALTQPCVLTTQW